MDRPHPPQPGLPPPVSDEITRTWSAEQLEGSAGSTVSRRVAAEPSSGGSLPTLEVGPGTSLVERELLGQGGMGVVHAAEDLLLRRFVALKRPLATHPNADGALLAEARTLARLDHPNIVPIHGVGRDREGRLVVVMKKVVGRPWTELLPEPDLDRDLRIALEVADALAFAHDRGVLHRDVKPDNVLIGDYGEVWLMDWGCSCALADAVTTAIAGTPAYMAPEMLELGAPLGPWTDVFLLGATLHRVFVGGHRNAGKTLREVLTSVWDGSPRAIDPAVDPELAAIIDRACAREPTDRPQTVAELAAELRAWSGRRQALALVRRSVARIEELRLALDAADPAAEALFDELRAGLRAARDAWPDSDQVARAQGDLGELVLPRRLAHGELSAAERLIAELPVERRGPWVQALDRARVTRDREAEERRARDLAVLARERRTIGVVVLVLCTMVSAAAATSIGVRQFLPREIALLGVVQLVLVSVTVVPFWSRIHAHPVTRGLTLGVVGLLVGVMVNRFIALEVGIPTDQTLRTEALFLAVGLGSLSLFGEAMFAWCAVPWLIFVAVSMVWPHHAGPAYPLASLPSAAIAVVVFTRRLRVRVDPTG